MILLTDTEGYEIAVNEQAVLWAAWDAKKECSSLVFMPDTWIEVQETPEEIQGLAEGTAYQGEEVWPDEETDEVRVSGVPYPVPRLACPSCLHDAEVDDGK